MPIDRIENTRAAVAERLLNARTLTGIWAGELSSSALSTATAVIALALRGRFLGGAEDAELVARGLDWLARHQNADGGWGDTIDSPTNISTTTLCWVAFGIDESLATRHREVVERVEACLTRAAGELTPEAITAAVEHVYGADRTFAVPILMTCALGGRFGEGRAAWRSIPPIPFELAALPHQLFRWLGLPMVSYALPALISVGQVIHHHRSPKNPLTRGLRGLTRGRTLDVLERIQPTTGGFLEATPLTSFVVMSLVASGHREHPVVENGVRFLRASVRQDGSWPIDTNLTTWVTTLSVNALAGGGRLSLHLSEDERRGIAEWLAAQQYTSEHPYTHAAPGGWAWTDLSGGVPDADDTAGALLALRNLGAGRGKGAYGIRWLLGLQNRDGGIPTFCRGWGKLPFDRSCPDLTAHVLLAWNASWSADITPDLRRRVGSASTRAVRHLVETQREDGAWIPLWFGNQEAPAQENPLYGTSRVIRAHAAHEHPAWRDAVRRGIAWIVAAQNPDGGWGGAPGLPPTVEETGLAVEALADVALAGLSTEGLFDAVARGADWLVQATEEGTRFEPSPIGLYFAKLWYSERLYPLIFTTAALERASHVLQPTALGTS